MKSLVTLGTFFTSFLIFGLTAQAVPSQSEIKNILQKIKVPEMKTISTFNHPVIDQSKPLFVEKTKNKILVRRTYIARWGVHRYEYGSQLFTCTVAQPAKKCEAAEERYVHAVFKSCEKLTKTGAPKCSGPVYLDSETAPESSHSSDWYKCEDYDQPCRNNRGSVDNETEFPDRYDSDSEMPVNMPI